jgi:hypothetical protein
MIVYGLIAAVVYLFMVRKEHFLFRRSDMVARAKRSIVCNADEMPANGKCIGPCPVGYGVHNKNWCKRIPAPSPARKN